ncbi:MAG TPA: hypothetical protein VMQ93_09725 [Novosphingobium sp.]|nr:hypothetical protein [Novosphingobium sp.]
MTRRRRAIAGAAFLGSAALCTSAFAAAAPTIADVLRASPAPRSGTCVMFTNGVCVCEEAEVVRVIDLTCGPTLDPAEQVCSYSRLIEDMARLGDPYWDQRLDIFAPGPAGKWRFVREHEAGPGTLAST